MSKLSANEVKNFFKELEKMESDDFMKLVETHVDDDCLDAIIDHLESFYGIEDDDELGHLAQLVVTGYLLSKQ